MKRIDETNISKRDREINPLIIEKEKIRVERRKIDIALWFIIGSFILTSLVLYSPIGENKFVIFETVWKGVSPIYLVIFGSYIGKRINK